MLDRRLAAIFVTCCDPDEDIYNQPVTEPPLLEEPGSITPQSCAYNGYRSTVYAGLWWDDYNPNYRTFGNDCTNFISQCVAYAGWASKGFPRHYKNWGLWWYDRFGDDGQTRSWTQAKALHYFSKNSGRAFSTTNICDLRPGDFVFADWNSDRKIDHAMIVVNVDCQSGWRGIQLAQHSPSRWQKSLWQYHLDEPAATFYAVWICHNS